MISSGFRIASIQVRSRVLKHHALSKSWSGLANDFGEPLSLFPWRARVGLKRVVLAHSPQRGGQRQLKNGAACRFHDLIFAEHESQTSLLNQAVALPDQIKFGSRSGEYDACRQKRAGGAVNGIGN